MISKELFGLAASATAIVSYAPYAWSVACGRTRPHTFSWIIWAVATGVAAAAMLAKGSGAGAWPTVLSAGFCGIIAVIGMVRGDLHATRLDKWLLGIALTAIPLWAVTGNPALALILMILTDTLAFAMTLRKAWGLPDEEMASCYFLYAISMALALAALQTYTLTTVLYPAFVLSGNFSVAIVIWGRRRVIG
jgi:hypothetical protein